MLPARDDTEGLLLAARFDCTSATFVGVIGRALRAAAAAADDKDALESRRLMNTAAAAVAAFGFAVSRVKGYELFVSIVSRMVLATCIACSMNSPRVSQRNTGVGNASKERPLSITQARRASDSLIKAGR